MNNIADKSFAVMNDPSFSEPSQYLHQKKASSWQRYGVFELQDDN